MANRFPLVLNTSSNQLQELASGDTLDLHGRTLSIADRSGTKHTIGFNLT